MASRTYFDLFGLEEKILLDESSLRQKFLAMSKAAHPDFHRGAVAGEASVQASSELNSAFLTLKDFEKRLNYVISLYQPPQHSDRETYKAPQTLLVELMDMHDLLLDYKHAQTDALQNRLNSAMMGLQSKMDAIDNDLKSSAAQFDVAPDFEQRKVFASDMKDLTLRKNYLRSLYRTIDETLNPSER
ncbi:MAG: hypothetical protein IAF08_06530 [Rhizobacter sp.]|nr:hypothetical protein [Chlorobiales bacterium]